MTTLTAVCAAELNFPLLWQTDLASLLESAATVADLHGDGRAEVLIAGREELFARDGNGKPLWGWRTKTRYMTYPAVLTRPGQPSLVYAADTGGVLVCLDGNGKEVWRSQLKGPSSWSASVVCDLNADGKAEVIQTDETGTLWAFEALTGKVLWQAKVQGIPVSPAVGDLDGDGRPEIVVATGEGFLTAIKSDGQVWWEKRLGGSSPSWATSAPVIFADANARGRIAAASSDGQLVCLNQNGEILWRHSTRGAAASTISIGDLDLDGHADICLITQLGVVYRFDESGRELWEIDMQGRTLAPGAMIDLDGDGKPEYAFCTQDGLLQVLNQKGEFIHRFKFKHRTINATPTFGDVSVDSPGLEMVITGGESGLAYCFATTASTNAIAQWTSYRGDCRNSGSWFGLRQLQKAQMTPANLTAAEVLTGQDLHFKIQNPQPGTGPLTATAVCIRPDGSRQLATTPILGKHGELSMPTEVSSAGIYRFRWTLEDAEHRLQSSGEKEFFLEPFINDRALVARALTTSHSAARAVEPHLPLSAAALRREAAWLELEDRSLAPLQSALPGNVSDARQTTMKRTAALVTRAQRLLAVSAVIQSATSLGPQTSLLAFEGTLWENRAVDEQLPTNAVNPLVITRTAVPGEHEPVALSLFNLTDHELLVRLLIDPQTNGIVETPLRPVGVPTSLGEISWDALSELDETSTLTIPSLASRQIWLDVDLAASKPGEHQVRLRLQALNGAGVLDAPAHPHSVPPPETRIEIALHVPSFTMADAGDFRLCTWAAPEAAPLPDLLAHGNNVFPVPLPVARYDSQGRLTNSDFSQLDPVLGRLHGKDVILLLQGFPALRPEVPSTSYLDDLKLFLAGLVDHLARAGFDTNHFALYPYDEPGGGGWSAVNQVVAFGSQVRKANPGILLYMDGGGELPMFQAMAPCMDIWTPGIYMLAEETPLMAVVRKHAKMLWSYNCSYGYSRPVGPNLKNMNLIGDYRAAAPFAFRHGATGIGFWCYNSGGDPWGRVEME